MSDLSVARCVHHEENEAVRSCARCGDHLCAACVDPGGLCAACRAREPLFDVPRLAWESREGGTLLRLVHTFGSLFRPWDRAAAFARGGLADALRFTACVSLPLSTLALVISATRTLLFFPRFEVVVLDGAAAPAIALDVARAAALGLALNALLSAWVWLTLVVTSGFSDGRLWARHTLYWSWLAPSVELAESLGFWAGLAPVVAVLCMLAMLVWWLSLWFTVRRAQRRSALRALLTSGCAGFAWMFLMALIRVLTLAPPS